eukprot:6155925-Prymnesium_polylepis.1
MCDFAVCPAAAPANEQRERPVSSVSVTIRSGPVGPSRAPVRPNSPGGVRCDCQRSGQGKGSPRYDNDTRQLTSTRATPSRAARWNSTFNARGSRVVTPRSHMLHLSSALVSDTVGLGAYGLTTAHRAGRH